MAVSLNTTPTVQQAASTSLSSPTLSSSEVVTGGSSVKKQKLTNGTHICPRSPSALEYNICLCFLASAEADPLRFIQDPTTGSRAYTCDAIDVLHKYCSSLDAQPSFVLSSNSGSFVCKVGLPVYPPESTHSVTGGARLSAQDAKLNASFEACLYLHSAGYLEYHHFPHETTTLVELSRENNAGLDNPRRQPTFHRLIRSAPADRLFATVFRVVDGNRTCRPFTCVMPRPTPWLPSFWVTYRDFRFQI